MRVNPAIVRAYDLRGVFETTLTQGDAVALGRCIAARAGHVVVGFDGRLSSPGLEAGLVGGLVEGGVRVERIGLGSTGMLYFAAFERGAEAAVMVTGSHNPPGENGFKIVLAGEPVFGAELRTLVEAPGPERAGGVATNVEVMTGYVDRLLRAAADAPALRVGWDPGNGAAAAVLPCLLASLPGEHHVINGDVDGHFPAHHPDPSVPDNLRELQDLVAREQLDLGIAFDGDGDRIGVVAGDGRIVWPDQLLLLLAQDVLARQPGAAVIGDVKSSRMLFDGIAAAGGRAVMSPSGYVVVRGRMRGEMSGHIFFDDRWNGTDDALHVAMRLLSTLGRRSLPAFLAQLPETFATPELRLACPDALKASVLDRVAAGIDGDRTDGIRVSTPDGWWLLRASGTEAKLTARVEGWTAAGRDRLQAELMARLREAGLPDR